MQTYAKQCEIWRAAREAVEQLGPFLDATIQHYKTETGLDRSTWFLLVRMLAIEPEPITDELLSLRSPYSSASRHISHLQAAQARDYIEERDGAYHLTAKGQAETQEFVDDLRMVMVAFDPLPEPQSERLGGLLNGLVQASLDAPEPAERWRLRHSYTLMPEPHPPFPFTEQAISCLAAFRDDCHLAAWQPTGLTGPALESLTYLWRADDHTLAGLHKQLVRRAQPRQVYRNALDVLCERGYIEGEEEEIRVTEAGREFRQQVEDETDRLFFTPWAILDAAEQDELRTLLTRLSEGLKQSEGAPG
ncbi:MAG: hypothetical protein J5I90_04890 [Caldilineales bacterium]|nr:hypothetical protein [Caldilineales bacterium]